MIDTKIAQIHKRIGDIIQKYQDFGRSKPVSADVKQGSFAAELDQTRKQQSLRSGTDAFSSAVQRLGNLSSSTFSGSPGQVGGENQQNTAQLYSQALQRVQQTREQLMDYRG